jgi:hypothetical protein
MEAEIRAILAPFTDAGCEFNGKYWEVWIGSEAGAREDGISLARELAARCGQQEAEPAPVEIPVFLQEPEPVVVHVPDPEQAAKIAALEARLAEAEAALEEVHASPPPEFANEVLAEIGMTMLDSPERIDTELAARYARYMGYAEYARVNRTYDGKGAVEWVEKAERHLRVRDWNRGRMAETI